MENPYVSPTTEVVEVKADAEILQTSSAREGYGDEIVL